jgi:hypothetical protein
MAIKKKNTDILGLLLQQFSLIKFIITVVFDTAVA